MKYYEMHEIVYKKLKEEKGISWDKSQSLEEMFSHDTNVYLKKVLNDQGVKLQGMDVLDLGTGTGTSALYCAKEGAKVTGIEISRSAIDIARQHNEKLSFDVDFRVGDILTLDLSQRFDLAIDSTVLHCLVGEKDRNSFYETVRRHIKPHGFLFINTMIASEDMSHRFSKEFFLFQDNILWSLGISDIQDRTLIGGKSYFPHRTILSESDQLNEFENQGFQVLSKEMVHSEDQSISMVALLALKT